MGMNSLPGFPEFLRMREPSKAIAEFMAQNDQSVDPPRQSRFVRLGDNGAEVWEDDETWLHVWPGGVMTEIPKEG